jgi:hypothetical protein
MVNGGHGASITSYIWSMAGAHRQRAPGSWPARPARRRTTDRWRFHSARRAAPWGGPLLPAGTALPRAASSMLTEICLSHAARPPLATAPAAPPALPAHPAPPPIDAPCTQFLRHGVTMHAHERLTASSSGTPGAASQSLSRRGGGRNSAVAAPPRVHAVAAQGGHSVPRAPPSAAGWGGWGCRVAGNRGSSPPASGGGIKPACVKPLSY